ncbi:hypothetical protein VCRA2113O326_20009 [Vibrio crassostreae]|nr:hypothetical protein VCRA2113O326_20009 [Vibrio crassostreae]CAK2919744.1 hypothetical protein VCRA2113O321_40279 [Vibrio crassostreae]CAK3677313.1 hypothetical protein VCRA2125O343_40285 [Vibrio crassostreae]
MLYTMKSVWLLTPSKESQIIPDEIDNFCGTILLKNSIRPFSLKVPFVVLC